MTKVSKPILMSAPMVRAILGGAKTQTRRMVKWPLTFGAGPDADRLDNLGDCLTLVATDNDGKQHFIECPYGGEGDLLWVREAFRLPRRFDAMAPNVVLAVTAPAVVKGLTRYQADAGDLSAMGRYRNGRFMPRALSRVTLRVTDWPTVERLQSITTDDAFEEGIELMRCPTCHLACYGVKDAGWVCADFQTDARAAFFHLFCKINGRAVYDANPWVWVNTFRRD